MHILIIFFEIFIILKKMEQKELNKVINKLFKIRINDIIIKGELDEETGDKIKNVNNDIENEMKTKKIINIKKNVKKTIPKDEKKMNAYNLYIKDVTNIIKDKPNLNYLPNNIINRIKNYKDKNPADQFKEFSIIWNELSDDIKNKYKKLCQDKDFTNIKYNEIVGKVSTPKIPRKKKSKDSLKNN